MTERQDSPYNASTDFEIEDCNPSRNRHFSDVLRVNQTRRKLLQGTAAAAAVGVAAPVSAKLATGVAAALDGGHAFSAEEIKSLALRPAFPAIAVNRDNTITVPPGYTAQVICRWGEPLFSNGPAFKIDRSNSAAEQAQQIGMHHDGMHFFPLRGGQSSSERGLLVMNHEYIDDDALHPNGPSVVDGKRPAAEVAKEIAAHGISVLEVARGESGWQRVDSAFNRRITGETLMELTGPVRGHAKVRTKFSSDGTRTRGTLNNCGHGVTPWGTYLTCEENWAGYFSNRDETRPREHSRYGVPSGNSRYGWDTAQERFDARAKASSASGDFRNEPNTFGYIVEVDPFDPNSVPKKRTALGRFGHEGCWFAPPRTGRPVVCYSGDDAQNEYIYRFVSRQPYVPLMSGNSRDLLDSGTLYVARFNDDGTGRWMAVDIANPDLQAAAAAAGVSFADQGDVILNTRLAADLLEATKMDRPEWGAVDPVSGEVYFTLTNNSRRAANAVDAANPRGPNAFGHILRWRPENDDHAADGFSWEIFVLSGTETDSAVLPGQGGSRKLGADSIHASPDGLWFDRGGLLWIQTDMSGGQLREGPFGNNQMLAADPVSGEIRRFLVGPSGCEVTGITMTPDLRSVFVNIQHPGEGGGNEFWPDFGNAPPRSATVVVTKDDGGIIGT
ncbi:PhoX family protein [Pseudomarimonas salicorniae]|uniref:PhoX family phosphatase n=1 Tax=Pseudomarimonas salicorniae TaxID=2933270 RepID=A0ABT0GHN5_9GAMM|nr:PhoX family phosphatase [Lysobacter sp. CAU 1642]MCK7593699.1 PhoX family phosphatase [Lysobacter sp. CAU 1642]